MHSLTCVRWVSYFSNEKPPAFLNKKKGGHLRSTEPLTKSLAPFNFWFANWKFLPPGQISLPVYPTLFSQHLSSSSLHTPQLHSTLLNFTPHSPVMLSRYQPPGLPPPSFHPCLVHLPRYSLRLSILSLSTLYCRSVQYLAGSRIISARVLYA
jgi:hypothetical protein